MPTYEAWFNPKSPMHKALIVADGVAYVGSPAETDLEAIRQLIASGDSPLSLMGTKPSQLIRDAISEIVAESPGLDLTLHYHRDGSKRFTVVTFADETSRADALALLETELRLSKQLRKHSPISAAMRPGVFLCIVGFLIAVMAGAASELEAGAEADIHGRRSGLKRLLVMILQLIGVTGVYVVGAVIAIVLVFWMVRRIKTPPVITTLKPS